MKIFDISVEISDIGDNGRKIGDGNSFERKIIEKLEILPKFLRNFVCETHARVGEFLLQKYKDIS